MRYLNQKLSSEIDVVRSVKFVLSCLIILDHTAAVFGSSPLWNLEYLESVSQSVDQSHQDPRYRSKRELRAACMEGEVLSLSSGYI